MVNLIFENGGFRIEEPLHGLEKLKTLDVCLTVRDDVLCNEESHILGQACVFINTQLGSNFLNVVSVDKELESKPVTVLKEVKFRLYKD